MNARTPIGVMALAAMLALWAADAQAQAPTVCNDPPAVGDRIECMEEAASTDDIDIDAAGVDIDTTGSMEYGVHGKHEGMGLIDIDVLMGIDANNQVINSAIDTMGQYAHGVYGEHSGTGDITIHVQKTDITTTGDDAHGVYADHTGDGNIDIDVVDGSDIDIQGGGDEYAIRAELDGDGEIDVLVDDTTTNNAIDIVHYGVGASTVRVKNSTSIRTKKTASSISTTICITTPTRTAAQTPTPM